jgi:Bbp16-like protein
MILDKLLQFDPAATAITVTAVSTNVLDLLNARDIAIFGERPLVAVISLGATFTAAGAATLTIQFQGSVDNITWTTYEQTDAIPKANLLINTVIRMPIPPQAEAPHAAGIPRYLRLNYVVATGPFTAGTIEADLVVDPQASQPPTYAPGVTVAN